MNDQALRFRFGIFMLAAIILLAVLTILFGGFPTYFKRTDSYTIVFTNAPGVAPGTPVRRYGVRIGEVSTVKLVNETGKVEVGVVVDGEYTIRKGDRATLLQGLLGGDTSIAFLPPDDPAKADPTPVAPGTTLVGISPADPGTLVQKAGDLVQPAQEALVEVKKVFEKIDKMTPLIEDTLKDFREIGKIAKSAGPELQKTNEELRLLIKTTREVVPEVKKTNDEIQVAVRYWVRVGERVDVLLKTNEDKIVRSIERMEETLKRVNDLLGDENQKNVRDILRNVKSGSAQLDSIAKETNELIKDTRVTVKQVNESLKKADEAIADLQRALKPLGERGPGTLKNIDEAAENLNKTIKDVRELVNVIGRSEGTLSKLVFDPSLYNNLNDSAAMTTKILPRLDRVLRDIEIFADKLARHPELLGIGGVVRPSSGLKESPSVMPFRPIGGWKASPSVIPYP